jgi:hypothetical protein
VVAQHIGLHDVKWSQNISYYDFSYG